jgi:hypothetical protein
MSERTLESGFKDYLGDGVYAHTDGYHIWLTTLEGMQIALEPEVYAALVDYTKALQIALIERHKGRTP